MGFKEQMDADWIRAKQEKIVHSLRRKMTDAYSDLGDKKAEIQAEIDGGEFNTVHADIVTEGLAVKAIIDDAVTALDSHTDFLNWAQPEE